MRLPVTPITRFTVAAGILAASLTSISCGEVARTGRAPTYVIVESIEAAAGTAPNTFASNLLSDVQTLVPTTVNGQTVMTPTIFNDLARVTFRLSLKNPGTATAPLGPTTLNEVTLTRYRVTFKRSDGRNTQGVDVPYAFDGAFTVTIPSNGTATQSFDIVRHQAKLESPLRNLIGLGGSLFISTIAEINFWGRDQAGNAIEAFATITVQFGDFADPQ
ncbi:MAG: hypothetical protein ACT4QD_13040 [Acidobacteriota bacterium]